MYTFFIMYVFHRSTDCRDIFDEAEIKLKSIDNDLWCEVAKELDGEESYQFLRAYTNGKTLYFNVLIQPLFYIPFLRLEPSD